jgi:hypothetical protein
MVCRSRRRARRIRSASRLRRVHSGRRAVPYRSPRHPPADRGPRAAVRDPVAGQLRGQGPPRRLGLVPSGHRAGAAGRPALALQPWDPLLADWGHDDLRWSGIRVWDTGLGYGSGDFDPGIRDRPDLEVLTATVPAVAVLGDGAHPRSSGAGPTYAEPVLPTYPGAGPPRSGGPHHRFPRPRTAGLSHRAAPLPGAARTQGNFDDQH